MNPKQNTRMANSSIIAALALAISLSFGVANAQTETKAEDHQAHHPEGQVTEVKKEEMDMNHMHSMMSECMKMHKDSKMCDHQMMEKCEKQMAKNDCMKMKNKTKSKK